MQAQKGRALNDLLLVTTFLMAQPFKKYTLGKQAPKKKKSSWGEF